MTYASRRGVGCRSVLAMAMMVLRSMAVMFVRMMVTLLYMTVRRAVVVMAASIPVASMAARLVGQDIAQQAAGRRATNGVKGIALRDDGPGRCPQAGPYQGVIGFSVARRGATGHGKGQDAYQCYSGNSGRGFHQGLRFVDR